MTPKEDGRDRRERFRARRIADLERGNAAMTQAAGLSADLRSIYGLSRVTYAPPSQVTQVARSKGASSMLPAGIK